MQEYPARVVTLQVEEVVTPRVTLALTTPLKLADEVTRIAIVSPGIKPATLVPPHEPFLEIAEHDPEQVAVNGPVKPETVTEFEVITVEGSTLTWFVKENAPGLTSSQTVPFGAYPASQLTTDAIVQEFEVRPESAAE